MGRQLAITFATFVLLIGTWAGLFFFQVGAPTETSRFVQDCLTVKHEAVNALKGRKLVVMTGSSGFYGVRAEVLADELGMGAVNMGVHAGLALDYLTDQTQAIVKPGDVVLMSLEYEHYWDEGRINNVLLDYIVSRDVAYYESLGFARRMESMFAMSLERLMGGVSAVFVEPARRQDDKYTCMANPFGDETRNTPERKEGANAAIVEGLQARSYAGRFRPDAHAWHALKGFADWCRNHDITLVAAFPSLVHFDRYEKGPHRAFFEGVMTELKALGIPTLGTPFASMYPKADFYDSRYHLLAGPAERHSRVLAEAIRPYLRAP